MTKKKGCYIYEIDRDDVLDKWLKSQNLCMTNSIFFEFNYTSSGNFGIVAGIDYFSIDGGIELAIVKRHQHICDKLRRPYFCVWLTGHKYNIKGVNLKTIDSYVIHYDLCNSIGKQIISTLLNSLKVDNSLRLIYFNEQKYSNFLHYIRGKAPELVEVCNDVYAEDLSYEKIARERHSLFGRTLYHSDIDLILYSFKNAEEPVMLVEFKSNRYFSNALRGRTGQEKLLQSLGQALSIPVVKIWHQEELLDNFIVIKYYNEFFKFNGLCLTGADLINDFKIYSFSH